MSNQEHSAEYFNLQPDLDLQSFMAEGSGGKSEDAAKLSLAPPPRGSVWVKEERSGKEEKSSKRPAALNAAPPPRNTAWVMQERKEQA
jgi:hypothetical protein